MKYRRILSATLFAAASFMSLQAASPVEDQHSALVDDHKIIFFGKGHDPEADSIRNLIENYYYDQFRSFHDPHAPYFLFMSRDTQLAMGIGGVVRMRGYFDWGGTTNIPALLALLYPHSAR